MSRPYININSASYAGATLSLNMTFYKLRGGGTMSVSGLSSSISFNEDHSHSESTGLNYEINEVTVGSLGTSSTTTYVQPTLTVTYGGTVSTTTNARYQLQGQFLNTPGLTAVGPTLSVFLASLAAVLSFTGVNAGFTASSNGTTLTITAPTGTGNRYNGLTAAGTLTIGASSFTYSTTGLTFTGGTNTYPLILSFPKLGGSDTYSFTV
jgi:hypothetical protein